MSEQETDQENSQGNRYIMITDYYAIAVKYYLYSKENIFKLSSIQE